MMCVACAKLGHPFDVSWSGLLTNDEKKFGKLANSRASLIFLPFALLENWTPLFEVCP